MLHVQIPLVEAKAVEAKAKASKQTVSEWIRATVFREVVQ
jgi:hypothetical protein